MALARVVSFDGVDSNRMSELKKGMEESGPPEGFPNAEFILLHDPSSDSALAIIVFDNEDDYQKGHAILDAMDTGDTPGNRTSVQRYDVATRMSS
jgi:hypothetical protein